MSGPSASSCVSPTMQFSADGSGKDLRQRVEATAAEARRLGLEPEFRANRLEVILSWRYKTPQVAFRAVLGPDGVLTGNVERIGKP